MSHEDGVVVQRVQLLDALEAVVDEERPGSQNIIGIDALLDASPHVVVPEGQAVGPLERLDHAVLAVPDLRPAACRVHGAVGHRSVQVVGEIQLHIVLRGGCVLVQAIRSVGPRDTCFGRRDTVANRVVDVGIGIGGVHIGNSSCQFASVIVGVGDDIRSGVCAARAGHGGSPTDCVVHVAVGGDRAVLHLRDEIAVLLV